MSFVRDAACLTSFAPMFSTGSSNSTSLATVTPSLTIFGDPYLDSRTTLRPFGPNVTPTTVASLSAPDCIFFKAEPSLLKCNSFAAAWQRTMLPRRRELLELKRSLLLRNLTPSTSPDLIQSVLKAYLDFIGEALVKDIVLIGDPIRVWKRKLKGMEHVPFLNSMHLIRRLSWTDVTALPMMWQFTKVMWQQLTSNRFSL